MEDEFSRKDSSSSMMESQDRRPLPRVVYNDSDVQIFRRCLATYMAGDFQSAATEIRGLRNRYTDIVHIQLNELIINFFLQRCVNTDEFLADMKDAMNKAYGPNFENAKLRDLTQVTYLYNYALIQFYLMRYHQSLAVMKTVEKYFDTLEDALVRDCAFLLIELYLIHHQIPEAMSLITYLEEEFDEQTGLRINLPENFRLDALLFDENSQLFRPFPGFRAKVQLYKVKVVNRLRIQGLSKKECKGLLTTHGVTNALPVYLKSQSEYNRGNCNKAIKLLNHLPLPSSPQPNVMSGDCMSALHYNNLACAHTAMGKFTVASVYFNKAMEENTKMMAALPVVSNNGIVDYNQIALQTVGVSRFPELMYNLGTQLLLAGQPVQAFALLVEASHIYHQNPRLWLRLAECCIAKYKNDVIDPLHRRKPTRYMIKGLVGSGKYRKMLLSPVLLPYQKQLSQRKVPPTTELKKDPSEPSLTIDFARMCLINALATVNRHLSRGLYDGIHSQEKFIDDMYPISPSGISTKQEVLNLKAYILVNLAFVSNAMWDYVGGIDYARQAESLSEVPGVIRFLISAYASEGLMRINRLADAGYFLSVSYINNVFRQMNADLDKEGQVNLLHPSQNAVQPVGALAASAGSNASSRSMEDLSNGDEQANSYERPAAVIKSLLHVPNDYLRRRPLFARNLLGYNHAVWLAMNGDLEAGYAIGEKLRSAETNADSITRARATQLCIYIRFRQGRNLEATRLITDECPEWKDRLSRDFDEDERKLKQLRESQGIPWPLDS